MQEDFLRGVTPDKDTAAVVPQTDSLRMSRRDRLPHGSAKLCPRPPFPPG